MRGQVIGLNTLKRIRKNVTGIGFALSSGDLLQMLHRFYPAMEPAPTGSQPDMLEMGDPPRLLAPKVPVPSAPSTPSVASVPSDSRESGFGNLTIISNVDSAEIYVDAISVGNVPAILTLPAVPTVLVKSPGLPDYVRRIHVLGSSKLTLNALFPPPRSP